MTAQEIDRIKCAIRHIQSSLDVDPWARDIAVDAMQKQIHPGGDEMNDRDCENCAHHTGGSCSVWECSFERKENDMIYRQDTIDAMEGVDWYHINKGGQLTHGANSKEDEPLYKAKDVYKVLNDMPSAQPTQTGTSNMLEALDCVERQAAIDIVNRYEHKLNVYIGTPNDSDVYAYSRGLLLSIRRNIDALPSAQQKIVRCRECKHCEHWYADKGRCFLWHEDGISVFEDGFCNYAERKTDE